jgi:hypothetical protein
MDVTYLQNNADTLIEHMRMDGYSKTFIKATPHNSQSKNRTLCIAANCR